MDQIYAPLGQLPEVHGLPTDVQVRFLVRGTGDVATLEPSLRAAVRAVAPRQPIDSVQPLARPREQSLAPMRLTTALVALFAVIALSISAIGVCGVAGASVSVRTRELGLRMALGATRRQLLTSVLLEGAVLGLGGLMLGVMLAMPLSRALAGLLFEVTPHDITTFSVVAGILLAMTIASCFAPARQASQIDSCVALRG